MQSILITDCLQNDFVGRIDRFGTLPNALHVGYDESLRLLGENPAQGPVARAVAWAHQQPDSALKVIHVRDWHDPDHPKQRSHLAQFGAHCIGNTPGAEFVFRTDDAIEGKALEIVNATTLSNFVGAGLGDILDRYADQAVCVGLMGVWTEAKITFLAYDLRSRYPQFQLGVCPALTASSSRHNHFLALDQLERILGVQILPSFGEFIRFLGGNVEDAPLFGFSHKHPTLSIEGPVELTETDTSLVRYLFRGCREVSVRPLDGGFSGNLVLATRSVDLFGQLEVPHVVKIGARGPVGQERTAFERIESVLGNSAPRVADFADIADRGAIKYRYASMGLGASKSLQKHYESGTADGEISRILDSVFVTQLGRLYSAAERERCDLLEYYEFSERWAPSVKKRVVALMGEAAANADTLNFPGGRRVQNIVRFYDSVLARLPRIPRSHYFSYVHGDLNGANIIIDGPGNVWLIDFFHSHRGHVLKDFIKLENDLLYIWAKIETDEQLAAALAVTDALLAIEDVGSPLPGPAPGGDEPVTARAWRVLRQLRGYYSEVIGTDRDTTQLLLGQIRYAVHTLGFDESSRLQKVWALYTASRAAENLQRRLVQAQHLRIDWLPEEFSRPGKLGLTWLPGRLDAGRVLEEDLRALREQGATALVCLLSPDEFARYGVDGLLDAYRAAGFEVLHRPVLDGACPTLDQMKDTIAWIRERTAIGRGVVVHCVGGLGRAGTVAACWLRSIGIPADRAIDIVRDTRSMRAIETDAQEAFVRRFE